MFLPNRAENFLCPHKNQDGNVYGNLGPVVRLGFPYGSAVKNPPGVQET